MRWFSLVLLILISLPVFATVPIDIVFDIDQTLATMIHFGPKGDMLADPLAPQKGIVSIAYEKPGIPKVISERYRVYDGVGELLQELKRQQDLGRVRISFFSGGTKERNEAILKTIALPDGTSAADLAPQRIYDRTHMVPTGASPDARIRERFKKDLSIINPNLEDVVLVDDIAEFVPEHQRGHVLWIDEAFPYPERIWDLTNVNPSPELISKEKRKFEWITDYLMEGIERRFKDGVPFARYIQGATLSATKTPFTEGEEIHFERGRARLIKVKGPCSITIWKDLETLLSK